MEINQNWSINNMPVTSECPETAFDRYATVE
jgi:hypothetical protein